MGKVYETFGIALDPKRDGDIIKLLNDLPVGSKSPYMKLAIREKMARDAKRSRSRN